MIMATLSPALSFSRSGALPVGWASTRSSSALKSASGGQSFSSRRVISIPSSTGKLRLPSP